jgi:hypothetical protein
MKARFIELVVSGKLVLRDRPYAKILTDLRKYKIKPRHEIIEIWKAPLSLSPSNHPLGTTATATIDSIEDDDQDEDGDNGEAPEDGYSYLLGLPLRSLTHENVTALRKKVRMKKKELKIIQNKSVNEMWEADLVRLEEKLDEMDKEYEQILAEPVLSDAQKKKERAMQRRRKKKRKATAKAKAAKAAAKATVLEDASAVLSSITAEVTAEVVKSESDAQPARKRTKSSKGSSERSKSSKNVSKKRKAVEVVDLLT